MPLKPYYEDSQVVIYHGDCRDVLPGLGPVETCLTDPPYGLSFMGKAWDHAVPDAAYWRAVKDAVLPGGTLLAFGGTRLWHWLAVGIEEAGWEIRDTLLWLYGSGFPKSLDISKAIDKAAGVEREVVGKYPGQLPGGSTLAQDGWSKEHRGSGGLRGDITAPSTDAAKTWDGWGTALKPAWEPVILAMHPPDGTFAENALEHGVAGLNVDGARIPTGPGDDKSARYGHSGKESPVNVFGPTHMHAEPDGKGRWPANVLLDEEAARMLDEASGELSSGALTPEQQEGGGFAGSNNTYGTAERGGGGCYKENSGGASRFFYTSKASRADRGEFNTHPTVKPTDLLGYLCMLTSTPTGGTVLDPFMGSGSTLLAANRAGRKAIGIEIDEQYCEIAVQRIKEENLSLFTGGVVLRLGRTAEKLR